MWFDDDSQKAKKKKSKGRSYSKEPILEVRARVSEQRAHRRRRMSTALVATAAGAGLLVGAFWSVRALGDVLFTHNDFFLIEALSIETDGRLSTDHIMEYAQVEEGMNLFAFDLADLQNRLEEVPLVSRIELKRDLPNKLEINVRERVSLAHLRLPGQNLSWQIDAEGYVLGVCVPAVRKQPLIVGYRIKERLEPGSRIDSILVADALDALYKIDARLNNFMRVAWINVQDPEYLDIQLESGERILLGRDRLGVRLRKVAKMLSDHNQYPGGIGMIDATGNKNFVISPKINHN